jgi:arylsulfatase A-like enzyme
MDILRDSYESCIAYIDAQIGRLFADLERRGMLENTMVVITSDHGEHFNEHGFVGHGQSVYRREVHVPLLIIPPSGSGSGSSRSDLARRGVVPEPVSLRDLPATIVDLLAIKDTSPFPGSSLAPLWNTTGSLDPQLAPSPVLSEVGHKQHVPRMERIPATVGEVKALISNGKVYIRNTGAKEEVFDLKMDPLEKSNIVAAKNLDPSLERFRSTLKQILAGKNVSAEALAPE